MSERAPSDDELQRLYTAWRAVLRHGVNNVEFRRGQPESHSSRLVLLMDDGWRVHTYADKENPDKLEIEPVPESAVAKATLWGVFRRTGLRGLCNVVKLVGKTFFVLGAAAVFAGYFAASSAGTPPPSPTAVLALAIGLILNAVLAWILDALATRQEERHKALVQGHSPASEA